ncbi:mas-related G-protein coupled receptor member X4-like [Notamacropus eugenii]|uniref:mas-related G-protein coupled receptor member X4-like n=1 Tax=Notamacropus eugenii TaxID=9315 RepID=UPI003B679F7D
MRELNSFSIHDSVERLQEGSIALGFEQSAAPCGPCWHRRYFIRLQGTESLAVARHAFQMSQSTNGKDSFKRLASERSLMELGPTTMAVSPSPGQRENVYDNASILSLVLVLVGLVGNSMVLWLLNFRTRRNPFSTYILNLTWTDLLFLCCYFLILMEELFISVYYSLINYLLMYLANAICTVGLSLFAAISTERCLAMLFPSWYLQDRPKNTSAAVCAVLWVLTGLFWGADVFLCICVEKWDFCEGFPRLPVVWLVHFTPVMCGSSLTLLLRVQCSSQRRQPPRLYLLILLMVLVFLLCGLPRAIQEAIMRFPLYRLFPSDYFRLDYVVYCVLRLLACLKSSAYPFIYFFLGRQRHGRGRETLRVVLQRALADEQELEAEKRDSQLTNARETSF